MNLFKITFVLFFVGKIIFAQMWYAGVHVNVNQPGLQLRALSFRDSLTGYACSHSGYLFKTTNGGINWVRLWYYQEKLECLSFINKDKGWCGTWEGKIFYTTNSGFQWHQSSLSPTLNKPIVSIQMVNENVGYFGTTNGLIYKSGTNGRNWFIVLSPGSPVWGLSFIDEKNGWVAASADTFIYRTTNGGVSWFKVGNVPYTINVKRIAFVDSLNGWLSINTGSNNIVMRTTDGGYNWSIKRQVTQQITNIYSESPETLWTCGGNYGTYYTSDAGNTWQQKSSSNSQFLTKLTNGKVMLAGTESISYSINNGSTFISGKTKYINNNLTAVYSLSPDEVVCVGTQGTVIHSTNRGGTWTWRNPDFNTNLYCMLRAPNARFFVGGDSGRIFYTDNIFTWFKSNINVDEKITAIESDKGTKIYTGTDKGTIKRTTDNGISWNSVTNFVNEKITDIHFVNQQIALVSTYTGNVYKTTNAGTNWTLSYQSSKAINSIASASPLAVFIAGQGNHIYLTSDTGSTWTPVYLPIHESQTVHKMLLYSTTRGYILANNLLLKTSNGGISWSEDYIYSLNGTLHDISKFSVEDGWAVGDNYTVVRFQLIYAPVELTSFTLEAKDNSQIILRWQTATESNNRGFEVQRSINGENFNTIAFVQGTGTSAEPVSYIFQDDHPNPSINYYRLKQVDYDGKFSYSKVESIFMKFNAELVQNYPNPFNPTTKIIFSVPTLLSDKPKTKIFVTLKVYNILGYEVSSLVNEEKLPGEYEIEFDGSRLNSGIYFYQLRVGDLSQSKKMILLK